jgi:hypothetical protein
MSSSTNPESPLNPSVPLGHIAESLAPRSDLASLPDVEAGSGQCSEPTRSGKRCRARAITGSRFCFFHDPGSTQERAAANKRGGEKKHYAVLPADTPDFPLAGARDVDALLGRIINQVLRGQIDPRIATTVG